jgi:hypothetical protein
MLVVQVSTAALILAVLTGQRGPIALSLAGCFGARILHLPLIQPNVTDGGGDFQTSSVRPLFPSPSLCSRATFASASSERPESARRVPTPSSDFGNHFQNRLRKWGLKLRLLLGARGEMLYRSSCGGRITFPH